MPSDSFNYVSNMFLSFISYIILVRKLSRSSLRAWFFKISSFSLNVIVNRKSLSIQLLVNIYIFYFFLKVISLTSLSFMIKLLIESLMFSSSHSLFLSTLSKMWLRLSHIISCILQNN